MDKEEKNEMKNIISIFEPQRSGASSRWAIINGKKRWIVGIDSAGRTIYETGDYADREFTPIYPFDKLEEFPADSKTIEGECPFGHKLTMTIVRDADIEQ